MIPSPGKGSGRPSRHPGGSSLFNQPRRTDPTSGQLNDSPRIFISIAI